MKSIMTSVTPYLCGKIATGQCKILVRKSAPKEVLFKAYIYATKPKSLEVEVKIEKDNFDDFDFIEVNGIKFKREK